MTPLGRPGPNPHREDGCLAVALDSQVASFDPAGPLTAPALASVADLGGEVGLCSPSCRAFDLGDMDLDCAVGVRVRLGVHVAREAHAGQALEHAGVRGKIAPRGQHVQ